MAKQFDVSRPSLREAIQRLEAKGLLLRRQGGGTFVQTNLWQSFSDPLAELLADHPESQFDLLETRHALEGVAAYYAALRGTDEDLQRIRECHTVIQQAQDSGDLDAEADAVMQYQVAVTEAAHNVVLLHLLRCMGPMLEQNVKQNFELLYSRREMLATVSSHRAGFLRRLWHASQRKPAKLHTVTWRLLRKSCWISVGSTVAVSDLCVGSNSARTRNDSFRLRLCKTSITRSGFSFENH